MRTETPKERERIIGLMEREAWLNEDLFDRVEIAFIREHMAALRDLPLMPWVTCHGDFGPHNWLVDSDVSVRVIDFSESRRNTPACDVARLCLQSWWDAPSLAAEFFAGYGRELTELERDYLGHQVVRRAVWAICWSRRRSMPDVEARARGRLADLVDGRELRLSDRPATRALRSVYRLAKPRRARVLGA